jgi:hypothetical protein
MISRDPTAKLGEYLLHPILPRLKRDRELFWDLRSPIVHEGRCIGTVLRQGLEKTLHFRSLLSLLLSHSILPCPPCAIIYNNCTRAWKQSKSLP